MTTNELPQQILLGHLVLIIPKRSLFIDQVEVSLTPIEYDIILLLMLHPERVFSRQEIIDSCWPEEAWVAERTVDVNISRLRKKISQGDYRIKSRVGFGYMLTYNI